MNKFLELHVLQGVPASNLNRDDAGEIKTLEYGNTLRYRVSSQSWKYAMRQMFNSNDDDFERGLRTKNLVQVVLDRFKNVSDLDEDEQVEVVLKAFKLAKINAKLNKDKTAYETDAILALSDSQINNLVSYINKHSDDIMQKKPDKSIKQDLIQVLTNAPSLDIALFGRMLATNPELNADATSQVAHAFTVNSIQPQYDFFVGTDDFGVKQGASMIGSTSFNSGVFYRYANLNMTELKNLLGDEDLTNVGIEKFIKTFVLSIPSGKQNSFAANTLPDYVMCVVRDDRPVSLANAFEQSVDTNSVTKDSVKLLEDELDHVKMFLEPLKQKPLVLDPNNYSTSDFNKVSNLSELVKSVINNG